MTAEWLFHKHHTEGLSTREIGRLCGVSYKTIQYQMKKLGVPRRDRNIVARDKSQKGKQCHMYGKKGEASPSYGRKHTIAERQKMSDSKCGDKNPAWQGGVSHHMAGYILIKAEGHPNADSHGYVLEHRLVMEQILGRYLLPTEIVHHINEVKDDNSPKNLMLFASRRDHVKYHEFFAKGDRNE